MTDSKIVCHFTEKILPTANKLNYGIETMKYSIIHKLPILIQLLNKCEIFQISIFMLLTVI